MTKVISFIHGVYPRSEKLVETSRNVERKRQPKHDLEKQLKKDFSELRKLQKTLKFGYIEDGKLPWQDIFRPIIEATDGLSVGPLTRWFDNNCFYRQPIITGKLHVSENTLQAFFPKITPTDTWKVTLPSPFTFAKLSTDMTTDSFKKTLQNLTELLATIIQYLEKQGIAVVQLNETYIPYHNSSKSEIDLFVQSLEKLTQIKKNTKIAIHFYFGDAAPAISALPTSLPIDIVGIDFYKTDLSALPKDVSYDIIAGIVEGRNSLIERETILKTFVAKVIKSMKPNTLYLSNNSDLELLPEPVARKKVTLLGKLQKSFSK